MKFDLTKYSSYLMIALFLIAFVYSLGRAILVVDRSQIGTKDGIYTNRVTSNKEIAQKAKELTTSCHDKLCIVQSLLNYVTNIPYKINEFKAHSPQKTIQNNFGDCDDKSNLLISMLHSLGIEAYFVLVPKHIFVITPLDDRRLEGKKALWIDGKRYYILESTAKGSQVGFPLHYSLDQIDAIIEPFSNRKVHYKKLNYK